MEKKYDIAQQVWALILLSTGMTIKDVEHIMGYSQSALFDLKKRAKERGYDTFVDPIIHNMHVENAFKSGRPCINLEKQSEIIAKVTTDRYGRGKSTTEIAREIEVSQSTVARVLKKSGYKKMKPTLKLDLTLAIKKTCPKFAIRYKDWTIEDWKQIIWSDETSVLLGQQRGNNRI